MDKSEVRLGQKVTYFSDYKREQGIIKSLSDDNHVFVVYHCADNWKDYEGYTAARTNLNDLKRGWC